MSELSGENKEQKKDKQQQPAIGSGSNLPQRILSSFEREPLTPGEIKKRQRKQKRYMDTRNGPPKADDFPKYFYAGSFIRIFVFLVGLSCVGAIMRLTLGTAKGLGWLNFSDSYLNSYGFTALFIYPVYFTLLTKFNHDQTIGKVIFGIRVINFGKEELSWSIVLVREGVCRFILKSPLLMLGYLPTVFSQKKQHLSDFFTNISVVTINLTKAFNREVNS